MFIKKVELKLKGLLLYFSATGNTKYIAKCIQQNFFDKGHYIDLQSLEENNKINIDIYDFLIIGSPKYYEYIPHFLIEWTQKNIPKASKPINTILFCTGASHTATSFKSLENVLIKKNYQVVMTSTFQMPNNYLISFFSPTQIDKCNFYSNNSYKKVNKVVNDFLNDTHEIEKISPFIGFLCNKTSSFFSRKAKNKSKKFSISSNCNKCNKCIRNCPANNISLKNNKITFGENCILCTRCLNSCSENAILYNNKKYEQYRYHINTISFK